MPSIAIRGDLVMPDEPISHQYDIVLNNNVLYFLYLYAVQL
jgi:hypothetical protein